MKKCAKCGGEKEGSEFHKNAKAKDGRCSYCKVCAQLTVNAWRLANPERRKINRDRSYERNKDKYAERRKAYAKANPERTKAYRKKYAKKHRLKAYGLTHETFAEKLARQNNQCAMCKLEFSEENKPVVDHCHSSGKTRDLLCHGCNTALGHVEKAGFLEAALGYLAKHKADKGNPQKRG